MPGLSDKKSGRARIRTSLGFPARAVRPGPAPRSCEGAPRPPFGVRALSIPHFLIAFALSLATEASAAPAKASGAASARSPVAALARFDSLLEAGDFPAAKALCTGQVLRMFDFLAMTHTQVAGLVDSAKSAEDTLEDSISGDWAYVKMSSHTVFRRPFLGQAELKSIQAVHLYRSKKGWLVSEFEELEKAGDRVRFRTGHPLPQEAPSSGTAVAKTPSGARAEAAGDSARRAPTPAEIAATPGLFPVSPRAPKRPGEADRMVYRLRLRNGSPLAGLCVLDAYQKRRKEISPSEWIVETRSPPIGGRTRRKASAAETVKARMADSLRPYLASNAYLILGDSLLQASAREARSGQDDPVRIARSIRAWVTDRFRFQLGAVLFGNSREVLRDMTGDCSEAAILAAALLRASGVPSRVALGFASPGRGVFIGHAWTEAWLGPGPGWVGVDAALGQFPAGVERVKLLHLDGRGDMRIAATNLMLAALSNIDIEILEARRGRRPLTLVAHPGAKEEGARFFAEILSGFGDRSQNAK